MKKNAATLKIVNFVPVLIGLVACFVPDAKHTLKGENFTTNIAEDYSGWGTILLLLLFLGYTLYKQRKQEFPHNTVHLIIGIYLLGFALFRAYHTLTLYYGAEAGSLAQKINANAGIREGLILLAFSGIWLIIKGINRKPA